jgi:hypothetical protein
VGSSKPKIKQETIVQARAHARMVRAKNARLEARVQQQQMVMGTIFNMSMIQNQMNSAMSSMMATQSQAVGTPGHIALLRSLAKRTGTHLQDWDVTPAAAPMRCGSMPAHMPGSSKDFVARGLEHMGAGYAGDCLTKAQLRSSASKKGPQAANIPPQPCPDGDSGRSAGCKKNKASKVEATAQEAAMEGCKAPVGTRGSSFFHMGSKLNRSLSRTLQNVWALPSSNDALPEMASVGGGGSSLTLVPTNSTTVSTTASAGDKGGASSGAAKKDSGLRQQALQHRMSAPGEVVSGHSGATAAPMPKRVMRRQASMPASTRSPIGTVGKPARTPVKQMMCPSGSFHGSFMPGMGMPGMGMPGMGMPGMGMPGMGIPGMFRPHMMSKGMPVAGPVAPFTPPQGMMMPFMHMTGSQMGGGSPFPGGPFRSAGQPLQCNPSMRPGRDNNIHR